jgi:hypothetical protein
MRERRFQVTGEARLGDQLRAEDRRWYLVALTCAVIMMDRVEVADERPTYGLLGIAHAAQLFVERALRAIKFGYY